MTTVIFGLYFGLTVPQMRAILPDAVQCGQVWVLRRDVAGQNAIVIMTFAATPQGVDPKHVKTWIPELRAIEVQFMPDNSSPDLQTMCEAEILDPGDDLVVFERMTKSSLVKGMLLDSTTSRRVWLRGKTWIELKTNHSVGTVIYFVDSTWEPDPFFQPAEAR